MVERWRGGLWVEAGVLYVVVEEGEEGETFEEEERCGVLMGKWWGFDIGAEFVVVGEAEAVGAEVEDKRWLGVGNAAFGRNRVIWVP